MSFGTIIKQTVQWTTAITMVQVESLCDSLERQNITLFTLITLFRLRWFFLCTRSVTSVTALLVHLNLCVGFPLLFTNLWYIWNLCRISAPITNFMHVWIACLISQLRIWKLRWQYVCILQLYSSNWSSGGLLLTTESLSEVVNISGSPITSTYPNVMHASVTLQLVWGWYHIATQF